jgi:exodeoxyribonuclease VII small subunit
MPDPDHVDFEAALRRLEEIVEKLDSGDESLEQSLALFEEGMRLKAQCVELLAQAEAKVELYLPHDQDETPAAGN